MATLQDLEAAGYEAALAFEGYTAEDGTVVHDVYFVTYPTSAAPPEGAAPTPPQPSSTTYLPDDPAILAQFLATVPHGLPMRAGDAGP